ncbi:methyltransferase domain-containing protein [Nocardia cyriacigeorgica]|nr:methyltransferase domain-containing protein [Nocardia cyriacigeorgica]MBF6477878.1 methyltransferase domain-containing protein [Nocardia cyriacigeorgica]MBF6552070.1 methyltransferase domain-containing protein [Nocardia cyriacigeorgica]
MPTLPREEPESAAPQPHQTRAMAESFGVDAPGYDRARPRYSDALVNRIIAGSPGSAVLDVGCGTGIAGRQFQAAGCTVLGVEPDARMAEFARASGLPVEVATFEAWAPDGRSFDAVIAAQSWHWVDPAVGAKKAAQVLRPGGRLTIFGHVFEPPPEVAEPFAAAYRRAVPDSPFADQPARRSVEMYEAMYAKFAEALHSTGAFTEPEHWRYDWEQPYTRAEWLALLPTTGGLTRLGPGQRATISTAVGAAIDALGGGFMMQYSTLAVSAVRTV